MTLGGGRFLSLGLESCPSASGPDFAGLQRAFVPVIQSIVAQLPRRGIIISYCLGWLRPWENQWLVYPPEIAKSFTPRLASLVGYQQHLPSLGNVEGQCPSTLLSNEPATPFVDALRPDQQELMEEYNQAQFASWDAA